MDIGEKFRYFGTGPSSFFNNKYPIKCAFDLCLLKDNNCNKELDNEFIKLTKSKNNYYKHFIY